MPDTDEIWLLLGGLFIVALIALVIYAGIVDQQQWQKYSADHHCIKSGYKQGQTGFGTGVGVDGNGNTTVVPVTTYTPDQTVYTCDNGEIIIR